MNDFDPHDDAELARLLADLPEAERATLLEEHRQLEKDLLRLADPLPPIDFVTQVMAKVAAAPALGPSRREITFAALLTFTAFGAGVVALAAQGAGWGNLGLTVANVVVHLKQLLPAIGSSFEVVWRTSAVPVAAALTAMLLVSVAALKKIGTEVKVAS